MYFYGQMVDLIDLLSLRDRCEEIPDKLSDSIINRTGLSPPKKGQGMDLKTLSHLRQLEEILPQRREVSP